MAVSQLTFLTTYRCPLQCRFCGTSCGPKERGALSAEFMESVVAEVASWGHLGLVVFTGGEPFLLGKTLARLIQYSRDAGAATRIVTSAHWASSPERALAVLQGVVDAGLTEINYSVDDFHQEFVPVENIGHAMDAAERLGLPYLLAHKELPGSKLTVKYLEAFLGRKLAAFKKGKKCPAKNVISTGITVPIGRGSEGMEEKDWSFPEFEGKRPWVGACASVMESIIVTPDKEVAICCGITRRHLPELTLGSLEREPLLPLLERGNRDLIVNWLALEGPEGIRRFIAQKAPGLGLPAKYANPCHLCDVLFSNEEVRAVLREHAAEKATELMLRRSMLEYARECCVGSSERGKKKASGRRPAAATRRPRAR